MKTRVLYAFCLFLVFAACKPRRDDSGLKADGGDGSTVSIDQEFLDSSTRDVEQNGRKAGYLKAMSDADIEEKRRSLYRDISTLSAVATDLVLWFDDVKERSKAGKIPEFSRSVDGAEFDEVQKYLAISQQQVMPILLAQYWDDLSGAPQSNKFSSKFDEIRKSLEYYEKGFVLASAILRRWNGSGTKWVSKSYARVKDWERRMINQETSGRFPSLQDIQTAFAKDKAVKTYRGRQLLQDLQSKTNPPGEWRGQYMMKLMAEIPEIGGLYAEPSGVSECYTVWEHTRRVIAIWYDQLEAYGYPEKAVLPPALMAVTVALHDIGKPVDVHRKAEVAGRPYDCNRPFTGKYDSSGQHLHNADIVRGVLQGAGATEQQQNIGYQLHGSDVLGEFAKGEILRQEALDVINDSAKAAGISASEFFGILRPFYVSDAGAYPAIYGRYIVFSQQQYNTNGWGGGGWGQQQQAQPASSEKLTTSNGTLEQLAQVINAPAPTPQPTPKPQTPKVPSAEVAAPPPAETGDLDSPMAGAPVTPGPNPVQAVKAQPADVKPKQTVSTIVPPKVLDMPKSANVPPMPTGDNSNTQDLDGNPAPSRLPAVSKKSSGESYSIADFCCYKTFYSESSKTNQVWLTRGKDAILELNGKRTSMTSWVRDNQLCMKNDRMTSAICFDIISKSELKLDEVTWSTSGRSL